MYHTLDKFKKRSGKYPSGDQFDEGNELYNIGVKNLLKSHNITFFSTNSDKKKAIVERFNRSLTNMTWKHFYSK